MEHFSDSFSLAYQKKLQHAENRKKESYGFLKSLAKVDNSSVCYILNSHQDKVSGKILNKNALEYASENKDFIVLKSVIDFFQNKKWDIQIESKTKKYLQCNISEINFHEDKAEQFLLTQYYQIPFRIHQLNYDVDQEVSFLRHFFSKNKIDNGEINILLQSVTHATNLLNANFDLHFFDLAFWMNKKRIGNQILKMNFSEKEIWINALFEQIELVCQSEKLLFNLIDKIEFYFLSYPKVLFSIIPMLTRLLKNEQFSAQVQEQLAKRSVTIIESLLQKNFKLTHDNKFHQFMLLWNNDYVIFDWNQFYNTLNTYFHVINKTEYFTTLNKIILTYKLERDIPDIVEEENNLGKI